MTAPRFPARDADRSAFPRQRVHVPRGEGTARPMHYSDWGRPDNPRVAVCAHGHGGAASDFDALAAELSAHYRVLCPDLRSRMPAQARETDPDDFAALLSDIDSLLFALAIDEVDWVGTACGGIVGLHLAVQPGTAIRRLVLKNIGEGALPRPNAPLGALPTGVHSGDLWKRVACPTVLLRGDLPAVSAVEASAIRRFLASEGRPGRPQMYASAAA